MPIQLSSNTGSIVDVIPLKDSQENDIPDNLLTTLSYWPRRLGEVDIPSPID